MAQQSIILIEKDEKIHAFTSLKKAAGIFRWLNLKSVYNVYGGCDDFKYKGARIRRVLLN